jgi:hypothetical protein
MAVNLSPVGGVAAQFFDNAGNVLTGGKLFTYAAGTTTPQIAYTTSAGNIAWSNPIIFDAAGRVSGSGEIWLTDGVQYKFILRDSNDVLIATYDNINGVNSNFVNFTNEQEIQTATAGQTVFNLTTTQYSPGTNSLSVFVDGVNQYGPGAQYAYLETDSDTVTFVNGLHLGALVKFTTSQLNSSGGGDAFNVSYLPPFTNSVGTNVGNKLAQTVSVKDFGAVGDGVTDDTAAIQAAWDWAASNNGAKINLPTGEYLISQAIDITGADNVIFEGDGVQNSIIKTNSATADVFYDSGLSFFRTFQDFSITSSVTKSAGAYFNLTAEKRSHFERLRLTRHFNGFNLAGFEVCYLYAVQITDPSGAGTGIIFGTQNTPGQGSGITVDSCFLRGNDDITQNTPTGLFGFLVYDVDAIFAVNCDVGGFVTSDMVIDPNSRSANHYFTQCFFDATKNGDCVVMKSTATTGVIKEIGFNGSWFASAGKIAGGNIEASGVNMLATAAYQSIQFDGSIFYNSSGTGLIIKPVSADIMVVGCSFLENGNVGVTNKYGLEFSPSSTASIGVSIVGNRFANANGEINFGVNANKCVITGNTFQTAITGIAGESAYAGNYSPQIVSSYTRASASTVTLNPLLNYFEITGTTNIAGITATYPGHIVTLQFTSVLTVINNSANLRLAGNYTTAAKNTLTLMCTPLGEWVEISRASVV